VWASIPGHTDVTEKLLYLFDINKFGISMPQCPTHYSTVGNGDVLGIVVQQTIRMPDVIVSDTLHSDHLLIVFHMHHVKIRNLLEPVEKFKD
jgi:hypothetical protein